MLPSGGACVLRPGVCGRWSRRCKFQHVHHVSRGEPTQCLTAAPCCVWSSSFVPLPPSSRSGSYSFSDSPLYSQTPPAATASSTYYETTPSSDSDIGSTVTSQPVSVATAGGAGSGGGGGGAPAVAGPGYVIQGSYTLGGGGGGGGGTSGGGGGGQSYSSPNSRAPPATVSPPLIN